MVKNIKPYRRININSQVARSHYKPVVIKRTFTKFVDGQWSFRKMLLPRKLLSFPSRPRFKLEIELVKKCKFLDHNVKTHNLIHKVSKVMLEQNGCSWHNPLAWVFLAEKANSKK